MKGILLAGGLGTRLYPATSYISKHMLLIYNKPMICYSLSTLMLANIREILVISNERDLPMIKKYLGSGENLGLKLSYASQCYPNGIAEALIIGERFIGNSNVCLILGDNFFYSSSLYKTLNKVNKIKEGAYIFAHHVNDPYSYGIVEVDANGKVISIEEKPKVPRSSLAITGLYFYDNQVIEISKSLKPSARGELEITDLNKVYLQKKQLQVEILSRGTTWFDVGTFDNILHTSNFVNVIENRQNLQIGCLEEIAYRMKFINIRQMEFLINNTFDVRVKHYLQSVLKETVLEKENIMNDN